jgi:hypothetical protein
MAQTINVNGEAALWVAATTASTAISALGVTVDGVEIELRDYTEPVFTDTYGPDVPFDEQQFLEDALIRAQLVFYDDAQLALIRSRPASILGTAEGTVGNAGTLWGGNATKLYFRLLVKSPTASLPYNFPNARLRNSASQKVGTRRTLWNLEFLALPYTGTAGAVSGAVLYNRTNS